MKPARFDYLRASSVDEAVSMLRDGAGDTRVLAGGQTLGPMFNMRLATPSRLVDIGGIGALKAIEPRRDGLRLGACVTHAALEDRDDASSVGSLMSFVASAIAFRAIRNRGTIGGSLAHADPAADWPAVMTLLDAQIRIASRAGRRQLPMTGFMQGAFTTAIAEGEVLEGIDIPLPGTDFRWGYIKVTRKVGEFPEAIGGAIVSRDRSLCRIVVGALDGAPALLSSLAERVARDGMAAAGRDDIDEAILGAAPHLDAVSLQMHSVAVRRAIVQACAP